MEDSLNRLQDKLRNERTTSELILSKCDFEIVENYADDLDDEEEKEEEDEDEDEKGEEKEEKKEEEGGTYKVKDVGTKKVVEDVRISTETVIKELKEKHEYKIREKIGISFPLALHRSQLNLQKGSKTNEREKHTNKMYYQNDYGYEGHRKEQNLNQKVEKSKKEEEEINEKIEEIKKKIKGEITEQIKGEKEKQKKKIDEWNEMKRYELTFVVNKNELAKLQWTNPVSDEEIREIKNWNDIKLHEIRFDFKGKLRIQINENIYNNEKEKLFDYFDGLYHHNDEPLNSGYTFPEMLILCQSTYVNQICIALKILKNIFINMHLKMVYVNKNFQHILNQDVQNKYCFGFNFRRFFNYINKDLKIKNKLLVIFHWHKNKNVETNCLHALASFLYPNNTLQIEKRVIYDSSSKGDCWNYLTDYNVFFFPDFATDTFIFFEGYNGNFYSVKKRKQKEMEKKKKKEKKKKEKKGNKEEEEDDENNEEDEEEIWSSNDDEELDQVSESNESSSEQSEGNHSKEEEEEELNKQSNGNDVNMTKTNISKLYVKYQEKERFNKGVNKGVNKRVDKGNKKEQNEDAKGNEQLLKLLNKEENQHPKNKCIKEDLKTKVESNNNTEEHNKKKNYVFTMNRY